MDIANELSVPALGSFARDEGLRRANESPRHRFAHVLHAPGAVLNRVFNFMLRDSYMHPHRHPSPEKIERISIVEGRLAILYFDDEGRVATVQVLERGGVESVEVPAFTWHTYVMLTDQVITYETMQGVYDPRTWKDMAPWAEAEGQPASGTYLETLRNAVH